MREEIGRGRKARGQEGRERNPGVMVSTCSPVFGMLRQEDYEFKSSLDYIVRPSLRKKNY